MPLNFQNKYTQASAKKAYEERPKMGDLVSDGTSFRCPNCPSKIKICVTTSSAVGDSLKLANTGNYYFPPPGGLCAITGSPCVPVLTNTDPGQKVVQIDEKTALGAGCKFQCAQGGQLFVDSPGQTVAKHEVSMAEIALDIVLVAGLFIPVVGEGELIVEGAIGGERLLGALSEANEASKGVKAAAQAVKSLANVGSPAPPPPDGNKDKGKGEGKKKNAAEFEKDISQLPTNERVARVREHADRIAEENGWTKDNRVSKLNNRTIYKDKEGNYYSVDTQHGRFEFLNKRGQHQGEVDMDLNNIPNSKDLSGQHNIEIK